MKSDSMIISGEKMQTSISSRPFPKVIGHRGACGYAPENTLASLKKAHELGINWVEFDVTLTQDLQAIVMHDDFLDRTTNGHGDVANATLEKIKSLDAGTWFSKKFADEKIPTFTQWLNCAMDLNMGMNVEIKPTPAKDEITARKIVEIMHEHNLVASDSYIVSSFSTQSLRIARSLDSNLRIGLLAHEWFNGWQAMLDELNCVSLHVNEEILNPMIVSQVKKTGRLVLAYTVNDPSRAQQLFAWGVDAVFSDFPDVVAKSLA